MEALAELLADKHHPASQCGVASIRLSIAGWINESCVKS
ncbi:hypothetical protein Psta_1023 [Pirellula staleyi DSM 6068]|uniref:Uncharacterized protein n=1 Tax=Pirellula staleyi (strain ATCC 27377 / DSM 6068 / ICPB 4128) TaxID=530564 RepID=D2R890_PIRSD|nr:hypothetical protein Psta_1023 [Pirellula staleyi DSM 6068]